MVSVKHTLRTPLGCLSIVCDIADHPRKCQFVDELDVLSRLCWTEAFVLTRLSWCFFLLCLLLLLQIWFLPIG